MIETFIKYFESLATYVMHNHEELDDDKLEEKSFAEGYVAALKDVVEYLKVANKNHEKRNHLFDTHLHIL